MVKADLVARSAAEADLPPSVARSAVEALLDAVAGALARGDRVVLRRFGVFFVTPRRTGMARNPRTGEAVRVPPGRVVRFRPGQYLRGIR